MADVRKLLQAERRLRETAKSKPDRPVPGNSRASTKRSLTELDEAVAEATKRPRTTKPSNTTFYDADGTEAVKTARGDNTSPQNQKETAVVERDDASMAGASDTKVNSSTLPSGFFGAGSAVPSNAQVEVDEDEWAAFQADVVEPVAPVTSSVMVIEAAPTTNNPAAAAPDEQDVVDDYARGEEEDAKQKLLDEFEEMEGLEQRVLRLKERREALKNKTPVGMELAVDQDDPSAEEDDDDDDEEGDDEDDFFRVRGS
ncbi:uncharacterized protein H6S33_000543 [Morchella sextelata]|uniref:uncharacterized protein n=1 Tax=Morchella sextelata TaxID=1174677 RepID=UPI001D03FC8D|nr:uncharacterized protein H6S33_000543 [Morchella sextelata]KAH0614907.1 hypothetical protein H6S33_000543 [Morchella sextelata]